MNKKKRPELVAPAGNLLSGMYAFRAGADAVYLGLKEFSARKFAPNFSLEEVRKLKTLASEQGKKIYVTLNTLIKKDEMERVAEALYLLDRLEIDGLVIQDLGVYEILTRYFPRLKIQASTQMAIHNPTGVAYLQRLGFKRVILPRELSFEQIQAIRKANPAMELEVFVHGALCYSFSGLCLASGLMLGRSGNRGECAQICRNDYQLGQQKGYFFSCRDLFLGQKIAELRDIGIDAFKIEGRMKTPEYVYYTTKLYRAILDNNEGLSPAELEKLTHDVELSFSRGKTPGYFFSSSGTHLINKDFSQHQGRFLGTVLDLKKDRFLIQLSEDLDQRDGMMFFEKTEPPKPIAFSVQEIQKSDKKVHEVQKGEQVWISSPKPPRKGQAVFHLSARRLELKDISRTRISPCQIPLDIKLLLKSPPAYASSQTPNLWFQLSFAMNGREFIYIKEMGYDQATSPAEFKTIIERLFQESNQQLFKIQQIQVANQSPLQLDKIFIPPAALKRLKNEFYLFLEATHSAILEEFKQLISQPGPHSGLIQPAAASRPNPLEVRKLRADLLLPQSLLNQGSEIQAPFVSREQLKNLQFPRQGDLWVIPLSPLSFTEQDDLQAIQKLIAAHPEKTFVFGINNLYQLSWADLLQSTPQIFFFIDFYLYLANPWALEFILKQIPNLLFAYYWVEGSLKDYEDFESKANSPCPVYPLEKNLPLPLFYSLGCFYKHNFPQACPPNCPKSFVYRLKQGKSEFTVQVRECVTYLRSGF